MTNQNRTEHHKKSIIKALEKSLGVVTVACKSTGIGRTQFYEWLKHDEEFAEAVNELSNVALDFAESSLHRQIEEGIPSSTIFYLKTKGKHRGYIEKSELDVTSNGDSIIPIQWVKNDTDK